MIARKLKTVFGDVTTMNTMAKKMLVKMNDEIALETEASHLPLEWLVRHLRLQGGIMTRDRTAVVLTCRGGM